MKLPSIPKFNVLTPQQRMNFIQRSIDSGLIGEDYSIDDVTTLYRQEQLSNLGLDTDANEDQVDAYLKYNKLVELAKNNQLGGKISPLLELYNYNPTLASQLSDELFDSGYLTLDEINQKAKSNINKGDEEGTSWLRGAVTDLQGWFRTEGLPSDQQVGDFSKRAFNDYYRKVKDNYLSTAVGRAQAESNPDKFEEDVIQQARRTYLSAQNDNVISGIQSKIDSYWDSEAGKLATQKRQELDAQDQSPENSNQISDRFNQIVNGYTEQVSDQLGNLQDIQHRGSNYWRAYKDSALEGLDLDDQKDIISKYDSYVQLLGPEKADEWLENQMQSLVSDRKSAWDRTLDTANAFKNTIVSNVFARPVSFGVWGLAKIADWATQGVGYFTGHEGETNIFGDIASIVATGRDQMGRAPGAWDDPNSAGFANTLADGKIASWIRQDYLGKVDQYNTWSRDEQQRADFNGGISGNEQYVLKPGQNTPDFWSAANFQDVLGMTSQIVGQVAALYLYGGGGKSFTTLAQQVGQKGAKGLLTKEAMSTTLAGMGEATLTATPIAESYAYGAYQQTFNGAMQIAEQELQKDAQASFLQQSSSKEYQDARDAAYRQFLSDKGTPETGLRLMVDSPETREYFNQRYDAQQLEQTYNALKESRQSSINAMVQGAALDTWMTSFSGEYLKYGMLNAALQPLKVFKSPNAVLQTELGTNAFGKLTQNALGKFDIAGKKLFGVSKWQTLNPKVLGAYNVGRNALIAGGLSNYTDELTTGFAVGFGLSEFNSEYLRQYDPEAYANTWHGGSAVGQFFDAIGSGIDGAVRAGLTEQAAHAFTIGAIGGVFAPRIMGRGQMREQYAQDNAAYAKLHGQEVTWRNNFWRKLGQEFNVNVSGSIGEFENTRIGLQRQKAQVKEYNRGISERERLMSELGVLNQAMVNTQAAQDQESFAQAANAHDALAMKLVYNQKRLSTNPLHQVSNQQTQANVQKLQDIADGNISDQEKDRLITQALHSTPSGNQAPITQAQKDQKWQEIQTLAKRTSDFVRDYNEAEANLLQQDSSLGDQRNYPILTQTAELIAKEKRLKRDIQSLSEESQIRVDTERTGVEGEYNTKAKEKFIQSSNELIQQLQERRQKEQDKLQQLQEQIAKETQPEKLQPLLKEAVKAKANTLGVERHIAELQKGIHSVENGSLTEASTGLSTDAIILHNMLTKPEVYSAEQQREIEQFKQQIGPNGEVYIREMAQMQDELSNNSYAQETLRNNPQDFLQMTSNFEEFRNSAIDSAIQEVKLQQAFEQIRQHQSPGIAAAVTLPPQLFRRFQQENPTLAAQLAPYTELNTSLGYVETLLNQSVKDQTITQDISDSIMARLSQATQVDADYFVENGRQGFADMIEFLTSALPQGDEQSAIKSLSEDFKKVASIERSTTAYTEYKMRQLAERARQATDAIVDEVQRQAPVEQVESTVADTSAEEITPNADMSNIEDMEHDTGEAIDILDEAEETSEKPDSEAESSEAKEEIETQEEVEKVEPTKEVKEDQLPAGVTRNSEGQLETMTAEQQAEQLGITKVTQDSMVDDAAPKVQEATDQQEEVHGCYFNLYDAKHLEARELVPFTEGHIYDWLSREGINLGAIIDSELNSILKVSPKVQLMKVKRGGSDINVASNVFLVVEYTDKVSKHHLPENGGVIESNGKRYLIIGTMWNTKAQDGTQAAEAMAATRDKLQKEGNQFFDQNPSERFYIDPTMNTEVTTFYSGHIVHTIDGESSTHSIQELLDQHNSTHTATDQMDISDLGFGVITMNEGFYPVGPHSADKIHAPQRQTVDKYGQVYVLVPAANGEVVPIFINPTLLSEIKDSSLKQMIDTDIVPRLLDADYFVREQAIMELCQLLCISGSITNPDGKGIVIGTRDIPTVSLMNGKSVMCTYNAKDQTLRWANQAPRPASIGDFLKALYQLDPRINLSISNLAQPNWVKRYDEAGALTTDSQKLGTYGGKYYVAPINPATGQPIRIQPKAAPVESSSDYSRASSQPTMLFVQGNTYVFRNGKWLYQNGDRITDKAEQTQILLALKVQNGEATLVDREGHLNYYVMDIETSEPKAMRYNIITKEYEGVASEKTSQLIAMQRETLERAKADKAAKELLEQSTEESVAVVEESTLEERAAEDDYEAPVFKEESEENVDSSEYETPVFKKENDFELNNLGEQDRYSLDQILESFEEDMLDRQVKILEIIEAYKQSGSEKWKDFNMDNIVEELEKRGIETTNIQDIDSWIDNLENCEG